MNNLRIGMSVALLISMAACGTDNETEVQGQTQTEALADSQGESARGVLSNQQMQALDAANSVQQVLQNSAEDREKELKARLQRL